MVYLCNNASSERRPRYNSYKQSNVSMFIMVLLAIIMHPSNATSTTDKYCVDGSINQYSWIHGEYEYAYWDSNRDGAVYYNSAKGKYLFPYIDEGHHKWYFGSDPDDTVVNAVYYIGYPTLPYTFSADDVFSGWYTYDGSTFSSDTPMRVMNCNDICISGSDQPVFDGTYVFDHYNTSWQGVVYYCTSCDSWWGTYLYPYYYADASYLYAYWDLSGSCCSNVINSDCWIGTKTLGDYSYVFDLTDCTGWDTYDSDLGWVADVDLVAQRCVAESTYSCYDKCYLHDETANAGGPYTCSDDCDCGSTRTCSGSYWCQGSDTFYTAPACTPTDAPTPAPTDVPTPVPTVLTTSSPTAFPTPSPTSTPKTACGDRYCYDIDLFPVIGSITSTDIFITHDDDDADTYFDIRLTANGQHCTQPSISFTFEEIDFASSYEYLRIYNYDTTYPLDQNCSGTADYGCDNWISCLNNYNLGPDAIYTGETYLLTVFEPIDVDALCSHSWSIHAQLTITCSDNTASPTSAPTVSPTPSPTYTPTLSPTTSPTDTSGSPTSTPTNAPSTSPSAAPTSAPTHCQDYAEYSNSGLDEPVFDYGALTDLMNKYTYTTLNDTKYFITNATHSYLDEMVHCADTDCFIQCNSKASCLLSRIVHSGSNNSQIIMSCDHEYACFGAHVVTQNNSMLHDVSIICNGTQACTQMSVVITDAVSVNIYCLQASACSTMDITLQIEQNNTNDHGIIHCVVAHACDFMEIKTNSELTQLIMYEYSSNIVFDNGIGYLSAIPNIQCNNDRYIQFRSWITETEQTVSDSILNDYEVPYYPCDGIIVKCDDFQCDMDYIINPSKVNSVNSMISTGCYWVNMQQLQTITCSGDCVGSPTQDPTSAPTNEPTKPTSYPTNDPTSDPTQRPTNDPTTIPTESPSSNPTVDPTIDPTSDPTEDPTIDPTSDPTKDPTVDPTVDPTIDPTQDPTIDPTSDPTVDPTKDPTDAPSVSPSVAPSGSPTTPPSNAPSSAPSNTPSQPPTSAPSQPPTNAPSRSPTQDVEGVFDTTFEIDFELGNLTADNKEFMVYSLSSVKSKIQEICQRGYFDTDLLQYDIFMVTIFEINGVNVDNEASVSTDADADNESDELTVYDLDINNILGVPILLFSEIETYAQFAGYIITKSGTDSFVTQIQQELQIYFENNNLYFDVHNLSSVFYEYSIPETSPEVTERPTAIYLSLGVIGIGLLVSALAFLFNQKEGTSVDNASFIVPFLLSLNIYDFMSDVNLSINMFNKALERLSLNNVILYLAVVSVVFIILPYATNLYYAMHITNQASVKENPAARAWFAIHLRQFIVIVVFTAGTYPVLALISSRIFGLEFFNAGLLMNDLRQLSQIKIRSTIYLENGPQLIIQILYSMMIGYLDDDTVLAFVASSLSIIATLIIYKAERAADEFVTAKYFIRFWNANGLNTEQQQKINHLKGLKTQLMTALCSVYTISGKSIEIGYITPNQYGCIIHVHHSVFKDDLDSLKEELFSDEQLNSGYNIQVTEDFYVENAFQALKEEICQALMKHFRLEDADDALEFNVAYHKRYKDANNPDKRHRTLRASNADKHALRQTADNNGTLLDIIKKHRTMTPIGPDTSAGFDGLSTSNYGSNEHETKHNGLEIELINRKHKSSEGMQSDRTTFNTDTNVTDALNALQTQINLQNTAQQKQMQQQMDVILKILTSLNQNVHDGDHDDHGDNDAENVILSQLSSYLDASVSHKM